ncbi:MAG: hypothetical protein A2Y17_10070 [Clostridiales bacterium GWF2_38_85]|nr:MAG: hypothetical protein A2Y17_10070 [Clostridiales bacterium GWF2_38_85]HBL84463.1 hypothetical protein [Clostridiales bacterium]
MFELIPFGRKRNDIFSIFDDFDKNMFDEFKGFSQPASVFRTDFIDNGDSYVLEAELPGFDKKDISLELKDGCLTVSAKKEEAAEDKKDNYIRRERRYGSVRRCFDVSGINEDAIKADYKDGVLMITLPKLEEKPKLGKNIEIN